MQLTLLELNEQVGAVLERTREAVEMQPRQPEATKVERASGSAGDARREYKSSRKNKAPIRPEHAASEILKRLERLTATGMGMREVFEDFIKLTNITLDALPSHWEQVQAQAGNDKVALQDPPEIRARWDAVMQRYARNRNRVEWVVDLFSEMFGILLLASEQDGEPTYRDVLGEVYMQGISHGHHGEFYTPETIARMMGLMLGVEDVRTHLLAAIGKSEFGKMMNLLDVDVSKWGWDALLGCYDLYEDVRANYETVGVSDPCCGSGVMFLGFAAACPRGVITRCLVKFYGADISAMAVEMCKLNFRLYGLNGWGYELRWGDGEKEG